MSRKRKLLFSACQLYIYIYIYIEDSYEGNLE